MKQNIRDRKTKNRTATIKDISEQTNFACSTVSAVLNDKSTCFASEATKKKIITAAKELGYHPNLLYRGLRSRKTNTIGLIAPNLHVNVTVASIEIIESLAWESGYHLFIGYSQNDPAKEEALLKDFVSRRVDGIILIVGREGKNRAELRYISSHSFPLVTIGKLTDFESYFVSTDYYLGGAMAARHLKQLGHKDVGVIATAGWEQQRIAGFKNAGAEEKLKVEEAYLDINRDTIIPMEQLIQKSYEISKKILNDKKKLSAFFAANDEIGLGLIKAAMEMGLNIPEDLSVIGFDDSLAAAFSPIPLTTIRQCREKISQKAFEVLVDKIENKTEKLHQELIPPELVIRSSTGPAKKR